MKILITTPLYPPDIGGPAQYAFNLEQEFQKLGHKVRVIKFSDVKHWPSGIRHFLYFFKLLPAMFWADWCLILDTFSVGLPAVVAGRLLGKKTIIRTGGDFLWENYVERTGKLVLLRNFYQTEIPVFSFKERLIFKLTHWILNRSNLIVFSTDWQRQIWHKPYRLDLSKTTIIENYYGGKEISSEPTQKVFVSGSRFLKWKNKIRLFKAFARAKAKIPSLVLDDSNVIYNQFIKKIKENYAVILVSLGDISPNMILDAIRYNKPFILAQETGLYDRLKNVGVFVDPEDIEEIKEKILWLVDSNNYQIAKKKIENFTFVHDWPGIAKEFLALAKSQ